MPEKTRILVVDDSDLFRKDMVQMLSRGGDAWETIEASGGAEGIKKLATEGVDLVLLDINMPDIDGFRFLLMVKDKFRKVPVIVVTARRERRDIARCFELGAADFIEKPVFEEELVARVRVRLREKEMLQEAAPKSKPKKPRKKT